MRRPNQQACKRLIVVFFCVSLCLCPLFLSSCPAEAQARGGFGGETATQDRLEEPGWWPTRQDASRASFVGSDTCNQCHIQQARTGGATPMARAAHPLTETDALLRKYTSLLLASPTYTYRIALKDGSMQYTVSSGNKDQQVRLAWAFGSGELGQTYMYTQSDGWHESRVSLYTKLGNLDITTGHSQLTPESLQAALGKGMSDEAARQCFGCHTTGATTGGHFAPQSATPGITCEGCHGPGAAHLAKVTATDNDTSTAILNPKHMSPVDSVDFCGACHRTWADVAFADGGKRGVEVVRFQPYRLEKSRCWGTAGDARITCTACHNPHQALERSPAAYDEKCLACHLNRGEAVTAAKPGKACPKAVAQCTTCHMPKQTVAQMHGQFTDHFIRIVREGALFPE